MPRRHYLSLVLSLSLAISATSPHIAWAQVTSQTSSVTAAQQVKLSEIKAYLTQMGFDAKEFAALLQTENSQARVDFAILDSAKDLSAYLLARALSDGLDDRKTLQLIEATSRFLNMGLRGLPEELPADVKAIADPELKRQKSLDFLQKYIVSVIEQTRGDVLGDILAVLYRQEEVYQLEKTQDARFLAEKEMLNKLVSRYALQMYGDVKLAESNFLGRALVLGLVKASREQKRSDIEQRLSSALIKKGKILSNYVSDNLTFLSQDGKQVVQVQDNDVLKVARTDITTSSLEQRGVIGRISDWFKNHFETLNRVVEKGVVFVKRDSRHQISTVWMKSGKTVGDINALAPQGLTQKITMSSDSSKTERVVFESVSLTKEARQELFYAADRAPMNQYIRTVVGTRSQNIQVPTAQLKQMTELVASTPGFKAIVEDGDAHTPQKDTVVVEEKLRPGVAPAEELSEKNLRAFLFELGFNDIAGETAELYKQGQTYNEHTKEQQYRNIKSYGMINASRELALLLMGRLRDRLNTEAGRKAIADLAGDLLSQQPINPVRKVPEEIELLPEERRQEALDEFVGKRVRSKMEEHTKILSANLLDVIYGETKIRQMERGELAASEAAEMRATMGRVYTLVSQIVERMYMDVQIGQTRFLGRAFLALLARHSEVTGDDKLMKRTHESIQKYGLHMENFIGNNLMMESQEGLTRVKMETMSYILTKNTTSAESVVIPYGAQPGDVKKGREMGVTPSTLSTALGAALLVTAEGIADGYGVVNKIRDRLFYKLAHDGYSHIGYGLVRNASNSNIKMTWVIDNYPHAVADKDDPVRGARHNAGGLRYIGLEQFYMTSHHSGMIVANPDPVEFHKYAMDYVRENGIPRTGGNADAFENFEVKLSETGIPLVLEKHEQKPLSWTIETPQEVLNDLYNEQDPNKFMEKYRSLFDKGMMYDLKRGKTFIWITPYGICFYGGGYCSSTGEQVGRSYTGLPLEQTLSQWHPIVRGAEKIKAFLNKIGLKNLPAGFEQVILMSKMKIIAPANLAAQKYVKQWYRVFAPVQSIVHRQNDDFAMLIEKKSTIRRAMEKFIPNELLTRFANMQMDPTERRAVRYFVDHSEEITNGKFKLSKVHHAKAAALEDLIPRGKNSSAGENEVLDERNTVVTPGGGIRCEAVFAN